VIEAHLTVASGYIKSLTVNTSHCTRGLCKIMYLKEYRIIMPLTVDEVNSLLYFITKVMCLLVH